jgi:hypothetical protein
MEKYMTDDRSQRARAAAEAGTATRDQTIAGAHEAFWWDSMKARDALDHLPSQLNRQDIKEAAVAIDACRAHIKELARLIAQRDGYAEAQSIGPDVALNGWGSKR